MSSEEKYVWPDTFEGYVKDCLDPGQVEDVLRSGADAGWSGFTYYKDTCAAYDEYESEIWERLSDDCDNMGDDSILSMISCFGGAKNVYNGDQFKNLLVWYMLEETCRNLDNNHSLRSMGEEWEESEE